MSTSTKSIRPFLKWAGGKTQLISEIEKHYPFNNETVTKYVEPFVGGGAILFDILNKYDLEEIYINDINSDLINAYTIIKTNVDSLIDELQKMQNDFIPLNNEDRKTYYLQKREQYNILKTEENIEETSQILKAALTIFLNKTCFNGLYRVNKKGLFNVPMGAYKNPIICDEENLKTISKKLQNVTIVCGDYKQSIDFIDKNTFVYIDPPYRPLTVTSSFTSYTENQFGDKEQIELAEFIKTIDLKGAKILLSNSDPKNSNENDNFFDDLYKEHTIRRVNVNRMINSKSTGRGKITELLITNF